MQSNLFAVLRLDETRPSGSNLDTERPRMMQPTNDMRAIIVRAKHGRHHDAAALQVEDRHVVSVDGRDWEGFHIVPFWCSVSPDICQAFCYCADTLDLASPQGLLVPSLLR